MPWQWMPRHKVALLYLLTPTICLAGCPSCLLRPCLPASLASTQPARHPLLPTRAGYTFPYLFDATTAVAQQYQAACTPEFYVFNSDLKLVSPGARHAFDALGGPAGVGIASQQKQEY